MTIGMTYPQNQQSGDRAAATATGLCGREPPIAAPARLPIGQDAVVPIGPPSVIPRLFAHIR